MAYSLRMEQSKSRRIAKRLERSRQTGVGLGRPISSQARELLELKGILRKHGYPTRHALRLYREGMGPEELEGRIRMGAPGAMGTLEYTHNIHRYGV